MTNSLSENERILAIDPISRGFGFVVFEGPRRLVDWGVKNIRADKTRQTLRQVEDLIRLYRPDVLVVEDCGHRGSRRRERIRALTEQIVALAQTEKVRARRVSGSLVQETFAGAGAYNKHQIAAAIARNLPEVASQLPPVRKAWMSEDYRTAIFDAAALALAYFRLAEKRRRSTLARRLMTDV